MIRDKCLANCVAGVEWTAVQWDTFVIELIHQHNPGALPAGRTRLSQTFWTKFFLDYPECDVESEAYISYERMKATNRSTLIEWTLMLVSVFTLMFVVNVINMDETGIGGC